MQVRSHVRFAPKAAEVLRCRELTSCAASGHAPFRPVAAANPPRGEARRRPPTARDVGVISKERHPLPLEKFPAQIFLGRVIKRELGGARTCPRPGSAPPRRR